MKTLRKIKFGDLGAASKIIQKLGLRIEGNGSSALEEIGASLFLVLIEKYHIVENDVAQFMSNLIEDMTKEEFLGLNLDEVLEYIEELKKDEGLSRFLRILEKLEIKS